MKYRLAASLLAMVGIAMAAPVYVDGPYKLYVSGSPQAVTYQTDAECKAAIRTLVAPPAVGKTKTAECRAATTIANPKVVWTALGDEGANGRLVKTYAPAKLLFTTTANCSGTGTVIDIPASPGGTTYSFRNVTDPAPGQAKFFCVTPATALLNPQAEFEPKPEQPSGITLMAPIKGATSPRISATSEKPVYTDGVGAFRVESSATHMLYDDPIVAPGQPGKSHLHVFFCNDSVNANSTQETLAAAGSTCRGGNINRSAYWVPPIIDTATNVAMIPWQILTYYKSGYNKIPRESMTWPPNGFRMIAGNRPDQTKPTDWASKVTFECEAGGWTTRSGTIPKTCADSILMKVTFPNCRTANDLDSPDHRSHVAYSSDQPDNKCPASHPVPIPTIEINAHFRVNANLASWKASCDTGVPGSCLHGDVWINWDEGVSAAILKGCIQAGLDCHAHLTGDGRMLN